MHFIYFFSFFTYFYFLGRGLLLIISKFFNFYKFNDQEKIIETPIIIFYPLIGVIFFSNYFFIANFFVGLKHPLLFFLISFTLIFNFLEVTKFKQNSKLNLITLFNLFIISISSYDINFQYDAGYYHLNYQNWIREEKLVFGLNNLHGAYGTSSIMDYTAAPFWLESNFILLHYLSIIFLVIFLNFCLYHIIFSQNKFLNISSSFVLVFAFLDNFGFNGGRNGFFAIPGIIKPDIASGVMFYLSSILISYLIFQKSYITKNLVFINFLILYSFQLKISNSLLFIFFTYIFILSDKSSIKSLLAVNSLTIIWLIKNLLLTSCLVFPINFTCFNLPWYNYESVDGMKYTTGFFNNAYNIGAPFGDWINNWLSIELNKTVVYNFLVCFLILFLIKRLFFIKKSYNSNKEIYLILLFIFSNLLVWIIGAPHPRFIFGLLSFSIGILCFDYKNIELRFQNKQVSKFIFTGISILAILLIPRINSYKTMLSDPFQTPEITAPLVEYLDYKNTWLLPKNGDQCWIEIKCIPYGVNVVKKTYSNYDAYIIGQ